MNKEQTYFFVLPVLSVSYDIIYAKYQPHIENELIRGMHPDKFAAAILIAFGVNEEEYELGLTKIFFRPAKAAVLDEIMEQADNLTEEQYKRILEWLAESRKNTIIWSKKKQNCFLLTTKSFPPPRMRFGPKFSDPRAHPMRRGTLSPLGVPPDQTLASILGGGGG